MRIKFNYEKDTKNTIRFKEDAETQTIGTLYIQKSALAALGWKDKESITVEITKEVK